MDWIASLFELIAKWMTGNKNRWCFLIQLVACASWAYVAIDKKIYGMFLTLIPFVILNIINFIKWSKNKC